MTWPNVRLTITPSEYSLLTPGLDFLACQLANAKHGYHLGRLQWDRTHPPPPSVYERMEYDEDGDQAIIRIRAKLWDLKSSRKIRVNFVELSAAALALRLLKRVPVSPSDLAAVKTLRAKLEKFRKQAKSAAISRFGRDRHATAAKRWRRFVKWVRYYLVFKLPKRSIRLRATWSYQRSMLAELIARTLADFGYAPLAEAELKRASRLIKEELRRGRRPIYLMELLRSNDPANRELLFHRVAKKCRLTPLPGVSYPYCVAAAARGEKFKAAQFRRRQAPSTQSGPPVLPTDSPQPCAGQSDQQPARTEPPKFAGAVADWFQTYVDRKLWESVGDAAFTTVVRTPPSHITVPSARSLTERILRARPAWESGSVSCQPDQIRDMAIWLLTWMYGFSNFQNEIAAALKSGYHLAVQRHESLAA